MKTLLNVAKALAFVAIATATAVAVISCLGCAPLLESEKARLPSANTIQYCETTGGVRQCKMVSRRRLDDLLRGTP